ncbi:hypothetical protein OCS_05865 [Ophiocordyceps sinensis CO18]|uniref:Uncharacterized protein n=1 Tax=Ophiocordyceps sinensis (strain Co18 / CGMCC 3.14243) TaxID=911162 RepID=T5A9D3_OPHSC|nr:hypothetical protein OCS_05865 [Ophiocordyceps sinensis CO18]
MKSEHESKVIGLETRLSEANNKIQAAETELGELRTYLAEALASKDATESELEAIQKSLETIEAEHSEKLRASENNLQKILGDHASKIEELQASLAGQHKVAVDELEAKHKEELEKGLADTSSHEAALDELKSTYESALAEFQQRIDALTASQAALESASNEETELEHQAHNAQIASLEGEIAELKARLEVSGKTAETASAEMESVNDRLAQIQSELAGKESALVAAKDELASLQAKAQSALADKDSEISKLKTMHDERMKNLSQDYENEIESLRGDAFFKRKFEELEAQHNDLRTSSEEATESHATALATAKAELNAAIEALEVAEKRHQQSLDALQTSHAEALESAKTGASADRDAQQGQMEDLKSRHAEELEVLRKESEVAFAKELDALKASHDSILEALKREHADDKEKSAAAQQAELTSAKDTGDGANATELASVKAELDTARSELAQALSDNSAIEAAKQELEEKHVTEIEKLIALNTEAIENVKNERTQTTKDLEELTAAHAKSLEDTISEHKSSNSSLEEKLVHHATASAELEAALQRTQEALANAECEVTELSQQLVQEKMERMTALADLDATKKVKTDTSEVETLRAELASLKMAQEEANMSVLASLQAKQAEVDAGKAALTAAEERLAGMKHDLGLALQDLQEQQAEAEAKHKTALADYKDLNDSMTALVEEANNKAKGLEAKLEEATRRLEEATQELEEATQKLEEATQKLEEATQKQEQATQKQEQSEMKAEEYEAQLKVKEAELAEATAKAAAGKPKGLACSKFADAEGEDDAAVAAKDGAPEGEDDKDDEEDQSLAALALTFPPLEHVIIAVVNEALDHQAAALPRRASSDLATASSPTDQARITLANSDRRRRPSPLRLFFASRITVSSTYENDAHGKDAAGVANGNGVTSRAASDGQVPTRASVSAPGPTEAPSHQLGPHPLTGNAESRRSLSYALRPQAEAYYDSRAATRAEWNRRAKTLDEYYDDNRHLLPQLPFTWHHGRRRWRLFFFAFFVFVDASAVPIALYYGMHYAGHVEGWIIFAIVTTIWGGPTYLEFAVRTLRLVKRERFFRPLGTQSRWCFDMLNWASVLTITAVTALFIVGSAPHVVWLRVLCMPAPAILYCLGGVLGLVTLYHQMGWPAPFRISSTAKGERVGRFYNAFIMLG